MDSGLIFPIIVALWLAYLVPDWIRRRERLSASRCTDRFSTAMRVLARRDRRPLERRPSGPGYVLMPPRRDLGHVVVKRTLPVDLTPTRRLAPSSLPTPTPRDHAELSRAARRSRRTARALAVVLLLASVATPALTGLVAFGAAPVAAPVLSLMTAAVTLVVLRRTVLRSRAARRTRRVDDDSAGRVRPPADARVLDVEAAVPTPRVPEQTQAPAGTPSRRQAEDGTWTPVPVPTPTYLLKPAAPRPAPALPVPVVEPVPRSVLPDLDLVLERRRASGE